MPAISSMAIAGAAIGAVGSIASAAIAPKGKDAAAAAAAGQRAAAASEAIGNAGAGLMSPQGSGSSGGSIAASIVGSPINYKDTDEFKIPDNPAYQLINKVDQIFRPNISGVDDD